MKHTKIPLYSLIDVVDSHVVNQVIRWTVYSFLSSRFPLINNRIHFSNNQAAYQVVNVESIINEEIGNVLEMDVTNKSHRTSRKRLVSLKRDL